MTAPPVPVSTLLSWALVGFTIEVDNAFEAAVPRRGLWLTSVAMWYSCMAHVPPDGIALTDLERATFGECALRGTNPGMVRWGYVTVDRDRVVHPTPAGRRAEETWRELVRAIEQRWTERWGAPAVASLRRALEMLADDIDVGLPSFVPKNAAHGGRLNIERRDHPAPLPRLDLLALMSKVLIARTSGRPTRCLTIRLSPTVGAFPTVHSRYAMNNSKEERYAEGVDGAALIRGARAGAALTQAELAERLGTTQSVVSRWERGGDEPRLSTLERVLRACGQRLVLTVEPDDVDRAQIRQHLAMTPEQRLASVANVSRMLASANEVT